MRTTGAMQFRPAAALKRAATLGVGLLCLAAAGLRAGGGTPRVVGAITPAADAVPIPETTTLEGISDDGRWLLLTSTSDRLVANDFNGAPDVLLFDRAARRTTLVSVGVGGASANGASVAPAMTADGSRVVFQSRASDLVANDTNSFWDVFVRDPASGETRAVSVASGGAVGIQSSTAPQITPDGRFVLFTSEARNLVTVTGQVMRALFRRDLASSQTIWLSQGLTGLGTLPSRTEGAALAASGGAAVFVANGATNQMFHRDVGADRTTRLSMAAQADPPVLQQAAAELYDPVAGADGRTSACRFSLGPTNGFLWFDAVAGSETAVGMNTNSLPGRWSRSLLGPSISADGRFLAYAEAVSDVGLPGPVLQVFRWQAPDGAPVLVSTRAGSQEAADAHAFAPLLTPDGRFVAFLSYATNLVEGTTGASLRAFLWDGETGVTRVVADLGPEALPVPWVRSVNGSWLGVMEPRLEGGAVAHLVDLATGGISAEPLEPVAAESLTGRGWTGVRASGVSADGRYLAVTAFPRDPAGGTNHVQVYRLDTQTGARALITQGTDGALANRHSAAAVVSADGGVVLFQSLAGNLTANDGNGLQDFFVQEVASGQRRLLRSARVPAGAQAMPEGFLSPEGGLAFLKFSELTRIVGRLASIETGALSLPFIAVQGAASFSEMGRWVAVSRSPSTSGTDFRVEVYNPAACLAAVTTLPSPLWTAPSTSAEPVLSRDGTLLAYLGVNTAGTNAVVVVDWAVNRRVFARQFLSRIVPSSLRLSADGRFVVWVAVSATTSAATQVWRGDVAAGTVALVSVASGGVGEGDGSSRSPAVSPDGRYVAFASRARNLVSGDGNEAADVFLRDMETGQTLLMSRTSSGNPGVGWSCQPLFSGDGRCLFFLSSAADLAPGDFNRIPDLFKLELQSGSEVLLAIRRNLSAGGAELLWEGEAGKTYRIEYKDELPGAEWAALPGAYAGGQPVAVDAAGSPQRVFRLREN